MDVRSVKGPFRSLSGCLLADPNESKFMVQVVVHLYSFRVRVLDSNHISTWYANDGAEV